MRKKIDQREGNESLNKTNKSTQLNIEDALHALITLNVIT